MTRIRATALWAAAYIGSIAAAGWAVTAIPALPLGSGVFIPAGVWFIAVTLTIRDLLHDRIGAWRTGVLIVIGGLITWPLAGPGLAAASFFANVTAELLDLCVYAPLKKRGKRWVAIALSNTVGLVADSIVFIYLAQDVFRSYGLDPGKLLIGQIIGKAAVTAVAVVVIRRRDARHAEPLREAVVAA